MRKCRDRKWHDRKWRQSRDRKWRYSVSGGILCACATGSCAISALVGVFWPEVTKSRDPNNPCPEAVLIGSRFCACPAFSPRFFLSCSNMATEGHLTPSGFPWVCACATGSCTTPVVTEGHVIPFGSVLGVFSTTSVSYIHRKPRVLYLAWWLELALVICPFYFRIVSI